jgi:hypothetical protein
MTNPGSTTLTAGSPLPDIDLEQLGLYHADGRITAAGYRP